MSEVSSGNDYTCPLCNHDRMIAASKEGIPSISNSMREKLRTVRILVADDFDLFRTLVSSILKEQAGYQIVGEAADGRQAVQRAKELQPDLVVLDMGIPDLRGMEVARRIKLCSPQSRILFLTTNNDPELACESLNAGAWGHVLKADVVGGLVDAAKAVISGEWFVGSLPNG
jgi:DNA-binding NarL/FixJ family response regulator